MNQIGLVGIAIVLVGLAMYIIWDKIRNVQKGLPGKDDPRKYLSQLQLAR